MKRIPRRKKNQISGRLKNSKIGGKIIYGSK